MYRGTTRLSIVMLTLACACAEQHTASERPEDRTLARDIVPSPSTAAAVGPDDLAEVQELRESCRSKAEACRCERVVSLLEDAPGFRETQARAALDIAAAAECPGTVQSIHQAAAGLWRASSGVLRAAATSMLDADWVRAVPVDPGHDDLLVALAADDSELVRAAALRALLARDGSHRAWAAARARDDESRFVTSLVEEL